MRKSPPRKNLEHVEQVFLFKWAFFQAAAYPELRLMFAIPNGGSRGGTELQRKINGKNLKDEGVRSGVPDILLPVARQGYHGLFIEMKYGKNKPSTEQKEWIESLRNQNYKAEVCYSCDEARNLIMNYLQMKEG